LKARDLLVLSVCNLCVCCGIYENGSDPSYGWSEFHKEQETCQRDHSHRIETDNMGAMEDEMPRPSVVDACLATKGWRRTDRYGFLTFLFPVLTTHAQE